MYRVRLGIIDVRPRMGIYVQLWGTTPLYIAAQIGLVAMVSRLLAHPDIDVNKARVQVSLRRMRSHGICKHPPIQSVL